MGLQDGPFVGYRKHYTVASKEEASSSRERRGTGDGPKRPRSQVPNARVPKVDGDHRRRLQKQVRPDAKRVFEGPTRALYASGGRHCVHKRARDQSLPTGGANAGKVLGSRSLLGLLQESQWVEGSKNRWKQKPMSNCAPRIRRVSGRLFRHFKRAGRRGSGQRNEALQDEAKVVSFGAARRKTEYHGS